MNSTIRGITGMALGAVGGGLMGWGITSTVVNATSELCLGGSVSSCNLSTYIGSIVAGMLIFMVAAFFSPYAWFTGPIIGLVTAGAIALSNGAELNSSTLGLSGFIAFSVLLGPIILGLIVLRMRSKRKLANHLVNTGQKGLAQVATVRRTNVTINDRPQLEVTYSITPLGGGTPFMHTKKQLHDFGSVSPQPGLTWPCWYDPADTSKVAVGTPAGYTPDTLQMLAQFGIPAQQAFGYDPGGSVSIPDPMASGSQMSAGTPPPSPFIH